MKLLSVCEYLELGNVLNFMIISVLPPHMVSDLRAPVFSLGRICPKAGRKTLNSIPTSIHLTIACAGLEVIGGFGKLAW